ncbi:MAG: Ig-like domain-containing protein, partial [Pseudomonadota bacterium]
MTDTTVRHGGARRPYVRTRRTPAAGRTLHWIIATLWLPLAACSGGGDVPAPEATDASFAVSEDGRVTGVLVGTTFGGRGKSFVIQQGPSNGAVTLIDPAAGAFEYAPNADYNGADGFSFVVSDGTQRSSLARVTLSVTPENDSPVLTGLPDRVDASDGVRSEFAFEVTDVDGDDWTIDVQVDSPFSVATIVDAAEGTLTLEAAAPGEATVQVTVSDENGASQTHDIHTLFPATSKQWSLPAAGDPDDVALMLRNTGTEPAYFAFTLNDQRLYTTLDEILEQARLDGSGDYYPGASPLATDIWEYLYD